ncbi:hypothetical protein [Sphingomonas sp.]|jgi:hypothetical protein|uniref:hypothetical protein n=1 Tax=Sphingomonas sp. TaxID=28214 RepID=UPI002D808F14|nr:hypothetical protein [Sphingomonas sp.]HEU0043986.1 hypothetical protein [Sphingomonas sp.]
MNDIARIVYGSTPSFEKIVLMNEVLSRPGDTDADLIDRFKIAGFGEEKSDRPGCRKLRFSSEFRPGKLPHVVAWFCGKDGRFVENGSAPVVAQTFAPLTVAAR